MKRLYLSGDTHGDLTRIINFVKRFNLGEDDNILILGDCGICWRKDKWDLKVHIENWETNCNGVNLYFIRGNHENHDILESIPLVNGVGSLSSHIFYLSDGEHQLFGKKIFVCGGADSIDKFIRTEGLSWWAAETVSQDVIDQASPHTHYDYILTHCCPRSIFEENKVYLCTLGNINQSNAIHTSEDRLEELKNKVIFDHWYFAHYHVDQDLGNGFRCLFNDFIEI